MSVPMWGINAKKRKKNGTHVNKSNVDLTLYDYLDIAKRCIAAFALNSLAKTMLKNEDAISFVAENLMYGAMRWSDDGGRSLQSYLNMCAIYSIHRWILLNKRADKRNIMSLDYICDDDNNIPLYMNIADKKFDTPLDNMCQNELMQSIYTIMDNHLTQRQKDCIELVYIQGYTGSEAARQLNISRQAVHQLLKQGISTIQQHVKTN